MFWIIFCIALFPALYALIILWHLIGIFRLPAAGNPREAREKVNVVVPFKDEEANLPRLVACLAGQDYPPMLFRVFLVNDHSADRSLQLARSLTRDDTRFVVLDLPEGTEGKKAALAWAIGRAPYPWILQTDADCSMEKTWIRTHMILAATARWHLIAGVVGIRQEKNGFLAALERFEMFGITGSSAGSFGWGRPLMCSGANLLYRKALYRGTRKFDPADRLASGDDMFLMIGARKLGCAVTYQMAAGSRVLTGAVPDWKTWWRQRLRWVGKSAGYRMPGIQATALLVALAAASVPLALAFAARFPEYWGWLTGSVLLKWLADLSIQTVVSGRTGEKMRFTWFVPVWLFYQLFAVAVALGSLWVRPAWKGRFAAHRAVR